MHRAHPCVGLPQCARMIRKIALGSAQGQRAMRLPDALPAPYPTAK